eukprot:g10953.t1
MFSNPEELAQKAKAVQGGKEPVAQSKPSAEESSAGKGAKVGAEEEQTRAGGGEEGAGAGSIEGDEVNAKREEEPSPPLMTPDQVEEFFQNTIARLTSPEEREVIKSKVTVDMRIPALLIEIQHEELERMGVGKEDGQNALNRYTRETAIQDKAAHQRVEDFTHICQRTFIEVLRDMEPAEEETEAKLTPAQIMEFFEACDTVLALPETKASLRKEFLETQVPPDETIVGMQRTMLRTLGFAPDHGVACLNTFSKDFPDDEKLQMRLQQFMRCASMARHEAMLGREELTKRMQMQQATMMKEHKMAMELEALDEAGRADLTKRVSEMQRTHAIAVMSLKTQEERLAYIKGIPADDQWEIAKLKMLNRHLKMQEEAAAAGGNSHAHQQAGGVLSPASAAEPDSARGTLSRPRQSLLRELHRTGQSLSYL